MTKSTKGVLHYLRRYIGNDPKRRRELCNFHAQQTKRVLHAGSLSRHLAATHQPNMDTALVYLIFLHREGQLVSGENGEFLRYTNPDLLRR